MQPTPDPQTDDATLAFIAGARGQLPEGCPPKIERCVERLKAERRWRACGRSNSAGNLLFYIEGSLRQLGRLRRRRRG